MDLIIYLIVEHLPFPQVNNKASNVQVITFGQPRIGNAAFASHYSKHLPNTIRVTNGHDMVPHLPPYFFIFPRRTYHHFPREVQICFMVNYA